MKEALKLALEALEKHGDAYLGHSDEYYFAIETVKEALAQPEQEPVAKAMTAHRAAYFMERFKHEEKLLGPNEQAALDFVISMLEAQPEQEPVAHFGSAYVNENGVHITTVLGPVAIPQDAKLYTTPPPHHTPKSQSLWRLILHLQVL